MGQNYYPSFMVNQLIDPLTRMWNIDHISAIIDPIDIAFGVCI